MDWLMERKDYVLHPPAKLISASAAVRVRVCVIVVGSCNLFISFVEQPLRLLLLVAFMQSGQAHYRLCVHSMYLF